LPITQLTPGGHEIGDLRFMRIADHPLDARQRRELLGSALGVAAGDHDLRLGILTLHAADGSPRILVGSGRHRTGI
jgi:hypothetical protein